MSNDVDYQYDRLSGILSNLQQVSETDFSFTLVTSGAIVGNAQAREGGSIHFGYKLACGLTDDEAAFVLAHEMGHCVIHEGILREHNNSVETRAELSKATFLAVTGFWKSLGVLALAGAVEYGHYLDLARRSKKHEFEADAFALFLLSRTQYRGEAGLSFLLKNRRSRGGGWHDMHPHISERITALRSFFGINDFCPNCYTSDPGYDEYGNCYGCMPEEDESSQDDEEYSDDDSEEEKCFGYYDDCECSDCNNRADQCNGRNNGCGCDWCCEEQDDNQDDEGGGVEEEYYENDAEDQEECFGYYNDCECSDCLNRADQCDGYDNDCGCDWCREEYDNNQND